MCIAFRNAPNVQNCRLQSLCAQRLHMDFAIVTLSIILHIPILYTVHPEEVGHDDVTSRLGSSRT